MQKIDDLIENGQQSCLEAARSEPGILFDLAARDFTVTDRRLMPEFVKLVVAVAADRPRVACWAMRMAYEVGLLDEGRFLAAKAIVHEDDSSSTHDVLAFVVSNERNSSAIWRICETAVRADPRRLGTLILQTRYVEEHLRRAFFQDGAPIGTLASEVISSENRLEILDGGATGSDIGNDFRTWPADKWVVYGFDPSRSANLGDKGDKNFLSYPFALGRKDGSANLHELATPGASSFYLPDQDYCSSFMYSSTQTLKQHLETVEDHEVRVGSIDSWRQAESISKIDYIKLNVQGAELDILQGADDTIDTVLGVLLEAFFAPHYEDAPGFGEIDTFLRSKGLILFDIRKTTGFPRVRVNKSQRIHFGPRTANYAWPSRQVMEAQLLYLRDPFHRGEAEREIWKDARNWLVLAVIAEVHGQVDFAIQLLEHASSAATVVSCDVKTRIKDKLTDIVETYAELEHRHY